MHPFRQLAVALALAFALAPACKKEAPPQAPEPARPLADKVVHKGDRWLFTFGNAEGRFETVDDAEAVPAGSRAVVRVVDPSKPAADAAEAGAVLVVDVAVLLRDGKAPAARLPRAVFESRALALLPPGSSSALSDAPAEGGPQAVDAGAAPKLAGGNADVIVYGTSWCGACQSARRYFIDKGIPFVDKDVEKDPAAARELQEKAAKVGIAADRVPVLDVHGRLLIGFDPARVQALLGEAI